MALLATVSQAKDSSQILLMLISRLSCSIQPQDPPNTFSVSHSWFQGSQHIPATTLLVTINNIHQPNIRSIQCPRESPSRTALLPWKLTIQCLSELFLPCTAKPTNDACMVRPTTSHNVAIFMKTLRVEKSPLQIAIRGGGHSILVGSSNIEGGIMLDVRGMNNFSL
jgi:hypothetical protein